jgi:hypothetical protein
VRIKDIGSKRTSKIAPVERKERGQEAPPSPQRSFATRSTYSKLERFIILGFVELPRTRQWIGTKVHVKHGTIKPGEYVMPVQFMDYLIGKAKTAAAAQNKISQRQNAKIEAAFRKNIDRVANSETFRALSHDVRLFGRDAFRKEDKEL